MEYSIKYEIPTYEIIMSRLKKLVEMPTKFMVKELEPVAYTKCGLPIMHYSIGSGPIHLTIMGGTHGNEIITSDFVTQFMYSLANGEGGFSSFPENAYTIDFFPIQNPESFVITTSGIKTKLKDELTEEEIIEFCKNYWVMYREADMLTKAYPDLHEKHLLAYQMLFAKADFECIVPRDKYYNESDLEYNHRIKVYQNIREAVKEVIANYPGKIVPGYPILWQATADGVNLNSNNPFNYKNLEREKEIALAKLKNEEIPKYWGPLRYSNILVNVPGPIGVCSEDPLNFKIAVENRAIIDFLDDLRLKGEYAGLISLHGTAGYVYNRPSASGPDEFLDYKTRYRYAGINQAIAKIYKSKTDYLIGEYTESGPIKDLISNNTFSSVTDVLNHLYPGSVLIELSKMCGNPIAPYGDKNGNYMMLIKTNLEAMSEVIKYLSDIRKYMYDEESVILPNYDPFTMEDTPLKR